MATDDDTAWAVPNGVQLEWAAIQAKEKASGPLDAATCSASSWRRLCRGKWIYNSGQGWIFRREDGQFDCRFVKPIGIFQMGVEGVKVLKSIQPDKTRAMEWVHGQNAK